MDLDNYYSLKQVLLFLNNDDYIKLEKLLTEFRSTLYTSEHDDVISIISKSKGIDAVNRPVSKLVHGVYHVEKVLFYCYLMVKLYNDQHNDIEKITDEFASMLYYAALYHDIGRMDNSENCEHGLYSAIAFHEYFKDNAFFKENVERLYFVQSLMNAHSCPDSAPMKRIIEDILYEYFYDGNWKVSQEFLDYFGDMYNVLVAILKDADALDRKRFGEWTRASLNPDFLRTDMSKSLESVAADINILYNELVKRNYVDIDISKLARINCFHSIGFDFFKIKSILKNGILSQDEMKRNRIKVPRNFNGGNFDRWISVVDESFYPNFVNENLNGNNKYAITEFTNHGITFYCQDVAVIENPENSDYSYALETGMPYKKSDYVDEKYAYNKIPPQNIVALFIPYMYGSQSVLKQNYIHRTMDVDLLQMRINYYKSYTSTQNEDYYHLEMKEILSKYEKIVRDELAQPPGKGNSMDFFNTLSNLIDSINSIIGIWIFNYYQKELGNNFNVFDVVCYELKKVQDIYNIKCRLFTNLDTDDKEQLREIAFGINAYDLEDNSEKKL